MQHSAWIGLTLLAVVGSGCYSGRTGDSQRLTAGGDAGLDGADDGDGDGDGSGGNGTDDGSADEGGVDDGANPEELPAPNTRLYRLTHHQWEFTIRDLLALTDITGFSSEFRPDAAQAGYLFENNAAATEVDSVLWAGYQRAATKVAELVVETNPALMDALVPVPGDAEAFIRAFGRKTFRRPLTDAEVQVYLAPFADAAAYYTDSTGFEAGVRLTIESMLQSPLFLYRIEASEDESGGVIPLDDFEVASRMSYFIWDSTPDDALLDAAEAGTLQDRDGVAAEAARMLASDKANDAVQQFHFAVHNLARYELIAPNAAFFPDAPEGLSALAREEHDLFVRDVIFEQDGSYLDLLTSTQTFVNQDTAPLYGLDPAGFGPEFTKVDVDPTQRRGIFTQIGFLAANGNPVHPDPIHRGAFLSMRVACNALPPPPANIPPPATPAEGQTNREAIEIQTQSPGTVCEGCHRESINPWGFPFEHYDSTGQWRDLDYGSEIDASTNLALGGVQTPVDGAVDLIDTLATSYEAHACYARHWVEFANGRPGALEDLPLVQRLAALSMEDDSIKDVIVELVTSRPFRSRATQEVQQ